MVIISQICQATFNKCQKIVTTELVNTWKREWRKASGKHKRRHISRLGSATIRKRTRLKTSFVTGLWSKHLNIAFCVPRCCVFWRIYRIMTKSIHYLITLGHHFSNMSSNVQQFFRYIEKTSLARNNNDPSEKKMR